MKKEDFTIHPTVSTTRSELFPQLNEIDQF